MVKTNNSLLLAVVGGLAFACSGNPDDAANTLPEWPAAPADASGPPSSPHDAFHPPASDAGDAGDGGPSLFPGAFRFECIHIHKLGELTAAGQQPFQAGVLNRLWSSDIRDHRLNILIGIDSLGADNNAQVFIGSGIGIDDATQCREPTTDGTHFAAPIQKGKTQYVADPANAATSCTADPPAGSTAFGTLDVTVPSTDAIYIYAQNQKGVTFNCTPDPDLPQAVPLRQVRAVVTVADGGGDVAGELTACLTKADILTLCSCIGDCPATDTSDLQTEGTCGGCPKGAAPLTAQLAGLRATQDCVDRTGGEAYELKATFFAHRLPGQPDVCGG